MKTAVSAWYLWCPSSSSPLERWGALRACCFALVVPRSGPGPQPSLQIAQVWETVFWWCLTIPSGLTFWLWMNLSIPTCYLYTNRAQTRIRAQTKYLWFEPLLTEPPLSWIFQMGRWGVKEFLSLNGMPARYKKQHLLLWVLAELTDEQPWVSHRVAAGWVLAGQGMMRGVLLRSLLRS